MNITIQSATSLHLEGILDLQQRNLPKNLHTQIQKEEGFVSVEHDIDILRAMNEVHPHAIALDQNEVVGYALAMDKSFGEHIPMLVPMFEMIDQTLLQLDDNHPLDYVVMGQICIAKSYRGQGVFAGLYQNLCERLQNEFNSIVTEVATRNTRSIKAHKKIGFKSLVIHQSDGEVWDILQWNW